MRFTSQVVASVLLFSSTSSLAFQPATLIVGKSSLSSSSSGGSKKEQKYDHHAFITTGQSSFSRSVVMNDKTILFQTATATESEKETYEFTSDVGRVMNLIINSLYSDKDIFLRELISNAADACDKKRFLSITSDNVQSVSDLNIRIKCNTNDNTLIIEDDGVGMTKEELINNLGKIAQSGTKAFLDALGESGSADVNLIGQFGVGFYSSYLVANKVEVVTKSMQDGAKQYRWSSEADSSYTIQEEDDDMPGVEPIVGSGTRLILHLKDDVADTYLETSKIEDLLSRYSEFLEFPISVWKETTEYKQVPDDDANKDLPVGETPKTKTVPVTKEGYERVNNQKPIWLRPTKDVTEQEYKDFYKSAFRAQYDDPMQYNHFVLEGQVECKALLYIPGMLPFELSKDMFDDNARNIRLYVKRVFINDKFDELMPRWLKFVRGVVDSNDLPLNVSREILQKSKVLSIINKRLVRKSIDMMNTIATDDDKSKYIMFWNNFGKYLKVGVVEDDRNRKEIVPLLRFFSSTSGEEYTSLDAYVDNMKETQKSIYYVTGDGREGAEMSPVVEKLTNKGYEVLYCTEPLDEIMIESIREYKDKNIVDAAKENLNLDTDETEDAKKEKELLEQQYKDVIDYLKTLLDDKIQKVVVSTLLTDSPAALVQGAYGMSPTMQRYMKAQAVASGQGGSVNDMGMFNKAVLEINPNHPIVKDLARMVQGTVDKDSDKLKTFALLMYDVAALTSGYDIGDAKSFAKRVTTLMDSTIDDEFHDAEVVVSKTDAVTNEATANDDDDDDDDDEAQAKTVEVVA